VQKYYVNIKRENPKLPILIRECSGVQPRLWTRYGELIISVQLIDWMFNEKFIPELGKEKSVPLTNVSADGILKLVESLH